MGCCVSAPYNAPQQPNSSSRAITSSQPQSHTALPRPSTHASTHSNRPQPQTTETLATHVNQPIRRHTWTSRDRLWTRAELDRERRDFFDTRVTGRPEIWLTIRAALQLLWAGGDRVDSDDGTGTAQQILDAAGITAPHGYLHRGLFDSFGAKYDLPNYVVIDPENMVVPVQDSALEVRQDGGVDTSRSASEELDEEELLRRREEKGKAVVNERDLIEICARLNDSGADVKLNVGKDDSVRIVSRKILGASGRLPPKHIRVAYMGKILSENQSLIAQGWEQGHVLNAFVMNG